MEERGLQRIVTGTDVYDRDGHKLGTVAHVHELDTPGRSGYLEVASGFLSRLGLGRHLYVPLEAVRDVTEGGVFLSAGKDEADHADWHTRPAALDQRVEPPAHGGGRGRCGPGQRRGGDRRDGLAGGGARATAGAGRSTTVSRGPAGRTTSPATASPGRCPASRRTPGSPGCASGRSCGTAGRCSTRRSTGTPWKTACGTPGRTSRARPGPRRPALSRGPLPAPASQRWPGRGRRVRRTAKRCTSANVLAIPSETRTAPSAFRRSSKSCRRQSS